MRRNRRRIIDVWRVGLVCTAVLTLFSQCAEKGHEERALTDILTDSITQIAVSYPGEIGVALIVDNKDTVVVNDSSVYPMMSVFKLHQALAVCDRLDKDGVSLDTLLTIRRNELDPKTWSPMLKDHLESSITLSVGDLMRYTLIQSDNNASNVMFKRLAGVVETDSFISTLIPHSKFQIAYMEADMSADHAKAYSNYTSPLGAAILMNKLFTDTLVSSEKQKFIMRSLGECSTGKDRIVAPLLGKEGVTVAHKTGSGYIDNGILVAHNDVAFITLPNGVCYTLAVFVKDFKGDESQASKAVSQISETVYSLITQKITSTSL